MVLTLLRKADGQDAAVFRSVHRSWPLDSTGVGIGIVAIAAERFRIDDDLVVIVPIGNAHFANLALLGQDLL